MAEKDFTQKSLEAYNDVFADIVNVLLFQGKYIVDEKKLETVTSHQSLSDRYFLAVFTFKF